MSNQSRLARIEKVLLAKGIKSRQHLKTLLDDSTGTKPLEGVGPVLAPILDHYTFKASDEEWKAAFPNLDLCGLPVVGWEME